MNREILFRGKSIGTGEWLYGHLFNYGLTAPSNVPCISVCVPTSWREAYALYTVLSKTIGQYTGMKDKNKKKIFEGEIVTIGNNLKAIVIWFNGSFRSQDELSSKAIYFDDIGAIMRDYDVQVIGNIHDNPELIK